MPELPEVQTVIDTLKNFLIGRKIVKVELRYDKIVKTSINSFKQDILNQKFNDILRYGKYLIFVLDDYYLIGHLRMEGKYFYQDLDYKLTKHDHIIFLLDNKKQLIYNDVRKFGTMDLISKNINYKDYINIGVDALSNEFNANYLRSFSSKKPIKTFLLDQNVVAGIGNIYVDEILFLSKIHPLTIKNNLNNLDLENIERNTKIVLNKALKLGGTTIYSYTSSLGVSGKFQNELLVHTKQGQKCELCGSIIEKIKVGGRGTYLCTRCQKLK